MRPAKAGAGDLEGALGVIRGHLAGAAGAAALNRLSGELVALTDAVLGERRSRSGHSLEVLTAQLDGLAGAIANVHAELAAMSSTACTANSPADGPSYEQPELFRLVS